MVQADSAPPWFRFVGRRFKRADAPERLTGRIRFTNDLLLPGALIARFVRSPYAAARIVSVDTEAALANAVFDACGARVTELPITPERVRKALSESAPRVPERPVPRRTTACTPG